MFRRLVAVAAAFLVVACSPNKLCGAVRCRSGVTVALDAVAARLVQGIAVPIKVCVDRTCKDIALTRSSDSAHPFVEVARLDANAQHTVTVTASSGFDVSGEYTGVLTAVDEAPGGTQCPGSCKSATVTVAADGHITP